MSHKENLSGYYENRIQNAGGLEIFSLVLIIQGDAKAGQATKMLSLTQKFSKTDVSLMIMCKRSNTISAVPNIK